MNETIAINVSVGERVKELSFVHVDGYMTIKLDGKEICWTEYDNLKCTIKRMLEIWGDEDDEE